MTPPDAELRSARRAATLRAEVHRARWRAATGRDVERRAPGLRRSVPAARALFALAVTACLSGCAPADAERADADPGVAEGSAAPSAGAPRVVHHPLADSLDAFIRTVVGETELLPGLSVAVVVGDEVVLLEGYGRRDVEAGLPIEAGTVAYIASSTKSFTGLLAALLDREGIVDLDAPVGRYLPDLDLPAPLSEDSITLRALLTHTSGLENDPVVTRTAFTGQHTPSELIRVLNEASGYDGPGFSYGNVGYVVASLAFDRVTGEPWQASLDERIFEPLGMRRTTAYVSEAVDAGWERAAPYAGGPAGLERLPDWKVDETMHAAGGLLTTAADLARWLEANLNHGVVDGERVFPEEAVRESHRKQAELEAEFYRFDRHGYGLGWYVSDYEGDTLLHHFGSFAGWRAHVSFMPEHRIGVAALLNETPAAFLVPDMVAAFAYDLLLGKPELEAKYAEERRRMAERAARVVESIREDRARRAGRAQDLPRPLDAYTGTFRSPALGTLVVERGDGRLRGTIGHAGSSLEVYDAEAEALRIEIAGSGRVVRYFFPSSVPDGAAAPPDSLVLSGEAWVPVR